MKNYRSHQKPLSRVFALLLAMLMLLSTTAFAANDTKAKTDPPPYTINRYGEVTIYVSDTAVKTDWNHDGCQLDTCFLTSDSLLRRLRLTFNAPYDLYDTYQRILTANTTEGVLQKSYGRYGKLNDYLSASTIRRYYSSSGIDFLYGLQRSREYQNSTIVQCLVSWNLDYLEYTQADSLRRSLGYFFYTNRYLERLSLPELMDLAAAQISTPEYIIFHNTLFDHDCTTVESLLKRGYSLDYVARLYSNQARAAVETLWPDYVDMMNRYWEENRAW